MNVLLLSTSSRQQSMSCRTSLYLSQLFSASDQIKHCNAIEFSGFDFPQMGEGNLNSESLSEFQSKLVAEWNLADLVVFCCPEYNWTCNGVLFQMLEHLGSKSFDYLFDQKVFAMVGVSSGRGGRLAAMDAAKVVNKLISFLGKMSVVSPKFLEVHDVRQNITEEIASSGNQIFERDSQAFVDYTLAIARRWKLQ